MSVQVNIYEAKSKFSKLISQAIAGEEIIIAKSGKPVAKLVPFEKPPQDRKPGSAKNRIIIADDFDEPLPDDILTEFYK
ncbi:MAG: type II toxin-antitoxin system Phd/YefM family antitoxin [Desulfobacteraceae bacterium]|jgi:prevent-host-death family protein|nr:type II toxin-antitoxin system Phd/YefM family antitoxin [Desulfobacteraceae bacterium]